MTMTFKIFHGPGAVHFIKSDSAVASGQPNQETFDDETSAVARVLELDRSFFPRWDREAFYMPGDRVRFGRAIYRALQQNEARSFELPDLRLNPNAEVSSPANRQASWAQVYDLKDKNLEDEEPAVLVADEAPKRRRARHADGTFKADDPSTPDVNEAWE